MPVGLLRFEEVQLLLPILLELPIFVQIAVLVIPLFPLI